MNIIPAIDLRGGRVVRLQQGDFSREQEFDHDPLVLAQRYRQCGARWLHVVDLDGALAGRPQQVELFESLAGSGLRVQAGGGLRTHSDVHRLLDAGIARVVVGSIAVQSPDTFIDWLHVFGAERLCMALDLRRDEPYGWRPAINGWQTAGDADFAMLLARFAEVGLEHVLCTDVAQDGMRAGPNLDLYAMLTTKWPQFAWIASGGVRDRDDVDALRATGVAACVAGTALLEGTLALEELACSRVA